MLFYRVLLNNMLSKEYYLAAEAGEGLFPHSPAHTNSPACTHAGESRAREQGEVLSFTAGEEQGTACKLEMALGEEV